MNVKTGNAVSLTGYDMDKLSRPLEQAYAIVQCVRDATCNASESPYIEPALSAAAELLMNVKRDMEKLMKQADKAVTE